MRVLRVAGVVGGELVLMLGMGVGFGLGWSQEGVEGWGGGDEGVLDEGREE